VNTKDITDDPPCKIVVPTQIPYDCLVICLYQRFVSEEGRHIFNREGVAFVTAEKVASGGKKTTAILYDEDGCKTGSIDLTCSVHPKSQILYPDSEKVKSLCNSAVSDASTWFNTLKPITEDLECVHVLRYACRFHHMPGYWFAVQLPDEDENERTMQVLWTGMQAQCSV
jgi:hypothetical protein